MASHDHLRPRGDLVTPACWCGRDLAEPLDVRLRMAGSRIAALAVTHRNRRCTYGFEGAFAFDHGGELSPRRVALRRIVALVDKGADPRDVLALVRSALALGEQRGQP